MTIKEHIAKAIEDYDGSERAHCNLCADYIIRELHSAGYVIIKDRTDPEGGIPGRG